MKRDTEKMYATMKPWKLFFVVALPGMISMFAMSIHSIIEGIFIGQQLGEGAFAAVNIAMPLVMINFSLADLIGVGASAPISIALGKKDRKAANNIFSCSVIMILITAILMGTVMFFAATPLCRMMGADDSLLETSVRYLRTVALCSPLSTIFFAMDNYLRISGYVKTSMAINIGSNLGTIGLLTFFLFGLNMDVVGSALATSSSMSLCAIVAMIPFVRRKTLLQFSKPHFHKNLIKEIAACGSPVFLNNIAGRVTSILINISLMTLGVKSFGVDGGTTGGEHRVEDEDVTLFDVLRELAVVRDRLMGLRVTEHADVADLCGRDELQDAVDHAKACAKDGNDGHLTAGEFVRVAGADGRLDELRLQRQVSRGFVALEHGELGNQLTEFVRTGVLVSQNGEFMLDERMVGDGNSTHKKASINSVKIFSIILSKLSHSQVP